MKNQLVNFILNSHYLFIPQFRDGPAKVSPDVSLCMIDPVVIIYHDKGVFIRRCRFSYADITDNIISLKSLDLDFFVIIQFIKGIIFWFRSEGCKWNAWYLGKHFIYGGRICRIFLWPDQPCIVFLNQHNFWICVTDGEPWDIARFDFSNVREFITGFICFFRFNVKDQYSHDKKQDSYLFFALHLVLLNIIVI